MQVADMTELSNFNRIDKPSYICALTDFMTDTDAEDGSILMVVDEANHVVSGYHVAFNGQWNEL